MISLIQSTDKKKIGCETKEQKEKKAVKIFVRLA